jgi:raffinose/stachyose/melibiose transport system substrate-binding protein
MRKSYRFAALIAVLLLGAALSFGVVAAQDPVVIDWWHISTAEGGQAYWQGLADAYTEQHPNVTFNITVLENAAFKDRLVTVMQAGDPPDIFQSWGGAVLWTYANTGLVRDIAPELTADNNAWKDSFSAQAALELFGQDGAYYGVPRTWGMVGFFYNKQLFEQAGITELPTTWTEYLATVQQLKDAGITPIALGNVEKWPGHFWWVYLATRIGGEQAFLDAYNRTGSFADAPFVQAGEYLKQLVDMEPFNDGFLGLTWPEQAAVFGNGQAAMTLMGQWLPGSQRQYSESGEGIGFDNIGFFPFPAVEGGAGNADDAFGGGDGWAIGINAPDEAVDFVKWTLTPENQLAGIDPTVEGIVPVVKGTEDAFADDPVMQAIVEARDAAPYFQLYYDQFLPPALGGAVNDAVEGLFASVTTPEEAAQAIEEVATFELE